jgi:hypothetical protein
MDDLTLLRVIRRTPTGPTDVALGAARTALESRMAVPPRRTWFAALVARLRRPSPLVVTFATIAAVAVIGIVVLSVFGTGIRGVRQPAAPVPTASATAKPTVGSQQVFGGDCSALLTSAQVSAIMGSSLTLEPEMTVANSGESVLPVLMRGGMRCTYSAATTKDPTVLYFVVLPESAKVEDPNCYGTNSAPACSFGSVASGLWISGVAYGPKGTTTASLTQKIDMVESDFAAKAATQKPVAVVTPTGAWKGTSCKALGAAANLADVLADPGLTVSSGNGPAESPQGYYTAVAKVGQTACIWESDSPPKGGIAELDVTILPGGSFARTQFENLPGAATLVASGTDGGVYTTTDGFTTYTVFSGTNLLQLTTRHAPTVQLSRAASALVQALNG